MSKNHRTLKEAKQQKRLDKIEAKKKVSQERKRHKGWFRVTCQAICGCCQAILYYETRERAEAACKDANLKHATMTDDEGTVEKVDGFYGFDVEEI